MFRLRDLKNGLYQIHKTKGPAFEGTPRSIFTEAIKMGIVEQHLAYAVVTLDKKDHDYADFTTQGLFIATMKNKKS